MKAAEFPAAKTSELHQISVLDGDIKKDQSFAKRSKDVRGLFCLPTQTCPDGVLFGQLCDCSGDVLLIFGGKRVDLDSAIDAGRGLDVHDRLDSVCRRMNWPGRGLCELLAGMWVARPENKDECEALVTGIEKYIAELGNCAYE